jgi:hypothetical protein
MTFCWFRLHCRWRCKTLLAESLPAGFFAKLSAGLSCVWTGTLQSVPFAAKKPRLPVGTGIADKGLLL